MRSATTVVVATSVIGAIQGAFGQRCRVETIRSTPPANDQPAVALQSYSYCGGTLDITAYVENFGYNKDVALYYTNRQDEHTPLTVLPLSYDSAVPSSNNKWEYWTAKTPVWTDGITELTNLTYQDVDNGNNYVQRLDRHVKASGAPEPFLSLPPKPYATPRALSDDITEYLAVSSQAGISHERLFLNINPAISGAVNGTVIAARSGPSYDQNLPDYEYNWVRDSSLTMDVAQKLYSAATDKTAKAAYETLLFEYAAARATEQTDPNLQTGLGEPKFFLNNTIFSGPWGRPQNDGPATSAITLIDFANGYLANNGSMQKVLRQVYTPMRKDLQFVASNWESSSFDLWEEVEGNHFYTVMVQRRALILGSKFAAKIGDSEVSSQLSAAAESISAKVKEFWDPNREILLYEYGPVLNNKSSYLDTAVMLGIQHGYVGDGFYSYTNDRVLSTAVRISTAFINVYPIANKTQTDTTGQPLSPPVGRYPEDVFNGVETSPNGGNPWYLCTATFAQFMYSAAAEYRSLRKMSVTAISKSFFEYFAPEAQVQVGETYQSDSDQFKAVMESLEGWGDAFMRTIKYYTPSDGHYTEEINRNTGIPQGAADLTWSYASVLTAAIARAALLGDENYTANLANLGVNS